MSNQNENKPANDQRRNNNNNNNNHNNSNYRSNHQQQQRNNYKNNNIKQPQSQQYHQDSQQQQQQPRNQRPESIQHKQSRLISISSSTGTSINCICCLHELETYAYYLCQHFVCLKCALKMRILCQKIDCPVCRQESKSILCTKKPIETDKQNIDDLISKCPNYSRPIKLEPTPSCALKAQQQQQLSTAVSVPADSEQLLMAGINFESDSIKDEYNDILSSRCEECGDTFREFDALDYHMKRAHKKFFCELCLENLKLFPYERKYYSREELATHKRNGDKSGEFKGHPLCHYCDNRFYDRDELYRHYRKEHYFCHFCDSDGHEEYYKDYSELRAHFLESHYLCEMDRCSYNAAQTHEYVVFRNELDLQAHKKQIHAKNKNDLKNYGKINIEFNVRERDSASGSAGGRGVGRGLRTNRNNRNNNNNYNNHNQRNNNNTNNNRDENHSTDEDLDETQMAVAIKINKQPNELINDNNQFPSVLEAKETNELVNESKKIVPPAIPESTATPAVATPAVAPADSATTSQSSQWRNMIGQGNAPKLNQETEFPSLASGSNSSSAAFPSLADLGFKSAIQNLTIKTTSKKQSAKKENQQKSRKQPLQDLPTPPPPLQPPPPASVPAQPPPGFSQIVKPSMPAPPPGFEKSTPPAAKTTAIAAAVSVTATKSVAAVSNNGYLKPDNYEARNEALSAKLKTLFGNFDESEYESFRNLSIQFRQNKIDSNSYLARSRALLDGPLSSGNYINKENLATLNSHLKFIDLIQDMIVLLPDATKQEELYKSFADYAQSLKPTTTPTKKAAAKSAWTSGVVAKTEPTKTASFVIQLVKCEHCKQYLMENELNSHQKVHHASLIKASAKLAEKPVAVEEEKEKQEEYPSLASTLVKPAGVGNKQPAISSKTNGGTLVREEFPPLSDGLIAEQQTRFSSMPTPSLFTNPSSHLSLVNKKKHRFQK